MAKKVSVMKKTLQNVVDFAITLALTAGFAYWSWEAVTKYLEFNVVTTISYTFGDNNTGNVTYPFINICPKGFNQFEYRCIMSNK